ncbi:MAG: DUF6166 domain-containing protein [Limisphaerales bacterium]
MKPDCLRQYMSADETSKLRPKKTYEGRRDESGVVVSVDGQQLVERYDLRNHSPTGFEWGYGGSGPAQLALALLADHLGNDQEALHLYQEFKFRVVAGLPREWWKLTSQDIEKALRRISQK